MNDFDKLERSIKRMERFPTRYLSGSVKKATKPILQQAKLNAPKDTGTLKDAIILKREKARPGKRVYQVTFDKGYNDKLAVMSKSGQRAYYPASQEYGWIRRDGTKVRGKYFMRNAADRNAKGFERAVINDMMKRIEREWKRG